MQSTSSESKATANRRLRAKQIFGHPRESCARDPAKRRYSTGNAFRERLRDCHAVIERKPILPLERNHRGREHLSGAWIRELLLEFFTPVLTCYHAAVLMCGDAFVEACEVSKRDVPRRCESSSCVPENRKLLGMLSDDSWDDSAFNHEINIAIRDDHETI